MPYPVIPDIPGTTQSDPVVSTQKANVLAANTPPTLALDGEVVGLTPANTGLPVNVPSIVQKAVAKSTGSVTTVAPVFASNNVAGNSIIVVCAAGNNGTLTVADTGTNTYTSAISVANSTTFETQIFYAVNIAGGANTVTVTNGGSAASMAAEIYEVSGLLQLAGAQPGQTSTGTGTGTTATTSSVSGNPNSLAFVGVAVGTAIQNLTAGTGWTFDSAQQNPTTPAGLYSFGSFSQYLPGMKSAAASVTIAGSEPWAMVTAVFKPVALGVEGTVAIHGYTKTNITTGTTTLVKTGGGVLHSVTINKLVASATIELDDAVTNTNSFGIITLPGTITALAPFTVTYDAAFSTGLSITTSGATDVTATWR